MNGLIDEWIDEWMGRMLDGWMSVNRVDIWLHGWMDLWMDNFIDC